MSTSTTILTPSIGLEITGASGTDLVDPAAAETCLDQLSEHGVLVYRDLFIEDEDLIEFSRLLGDLVVVSTGEHARPEIQTITLHPETAARHLVPFRIANFHWHFDGTHDPLPQKATLLSAQEIDDAGAGGTEFASSCAAYDALPEATKAQLEELEVVHTLATALEKAHPEASEKERAVWNRIEPRVHPLVWRHRSGRRSLLIGSTAKEIVGMPPEEGRRLLDELLTQVTQPEFVLRHEWRRGDLVIWDNTLVLHRALPFEVTSPRLLHRTTIAGEAPLR